MAYNPQLYQMNQLNTGQPMYPSVPAYPNIGTNAMGNVQPYYPNVAAPPLSLSAAYTKGEIGASSFPVASGNTVVLLDSDTIDTDNPIIYIKTTGFDGKPQTIKKISGTVSYPNEQGLFTMPTIEAPVPQIDLSDYASKNDLTAFQEDIKGITDRLNGLDETIGNINESISNIDNRFSNMFNAVSGNQNNQNNQNNGNKNNNGRKGNNN